MRSKLFPVLLFVFSLAVLASCAQPNPLESTPPAEKFVEAEPFPISVEYTAPHSLLKSGSLAFTISDARLIGNVAELSNPDGILSNSWAVFPNDAYENEMVLNYPDFIQEDGSFYKGVYLIVIDLSVTSNDAVAYTRRDLNKFGDPMGKFDDPHLFLAAGYLFLQDTHIGENGIVTYTDADGTAYERVAGWGIDYFSLLGSRKEDEMAFRLMPGESISFQVGFVVVDRNDGGEMDLNTLYLTRTPGDPDAFITHLDLRPKEE